MRWSLGWRLSLSRLYLLVGSSLGLSTTDTDSNSHPRPECGFSVVDAIGVTASTYDLHMQKISDWKYRGGPWRCWR